MSGAEKRKLSKEKEWWNNFKDQAIEGVFNKTIKYHYLFWGTLKQFNNIAVLMSEYCRV